MDRVAIGGGRLACEDVSHPDEKLGRNERRHLLLRRAHERQIAPLRRDMQEASQARARNRGPRRPSGGPTS